MQSLVLLSLICYSLAVEFFVSPNANDSNDGLSSQNAFATLRAAQSALRNSINTAPSSDIIVTLAPGLTSTSRILIKKVNTELSRHFLSMPPILEVLRGKLHLEGQISMQNL